LRFPQTTIPLPSTASIQARLRSGATRKQGGYQCQDDEPMILHAISHVQKMTELSGAGTDHSSVFIEYHNFMTMSAPTPRF
jgi:hypothetical protein